MIKKLKITPLEINSKVIPPIISIVESGSSLRKEVIVHSPLKTENKPK